MTKHTRLKIIAFAALALASGAYSNLLGSPPRLEGEFDLCWVACPDNVTKQAACEEQSGAWNGSPCWHSCSGPEGWRPIGITCIYVG